MSFSNTRRRVEAERSNVTGGFREARINPLRTNDTKKWIKKRGSVNENYRQDISDKKDMCDLATVFYRLSGNQEQVHMEEVIKMFKNINIWVTKYEVKKVTNSRDWVTLDHFKSLMESKIMKIKF